MGFLENNHGLYIEGNDWAADHRREDIFQYFNIEYVGYSGNNVVNRLNAAEEGRFGEQMFGYNNGYSNNRPDHVNPLEGAEDILTCNLGNIRGVYNDAGAYRTYSQSVSLIGMSNQGNFNRHTYLRSVLDALAGYQGEISGQVVNNMTGAAIEGATVSIPECNKTVTTDNQGNFMIDRIPNEQFTLTIECRGYTSIDAAEYSFDGQDELNMEIRMLHPELTLEPNIIEENVEVNRTLDMAITISNPGDGPLDYSTRIRAAHIEGQMWDSMTELNTGEIVADTRLQAAVFFQGNYWIAGGNSGRDNPNQLYKVSPEGELLDQWDQGSESTYGWRDLTTDGEFIYGVDSNEIIKIDPETGVACDTIRSDYIPNPAYAITYDAVNELFWVASATTNMCAISHQGVYSGIVQNRQRFRMSGLMWYEDDPDGFKMYVINNNSMREPEIRNINTNTQEDVLVENMAYLGDTTPGGGEMSSEIFPFTTTAVLQMQGEQDWLQIHEAGNNFFWLDVNPKVSSIEANSTLDMTLSLDPTELVVGESYTGFVQFDHNTPVATALWMEVTLNVLAENAVEDEVSLPNQFGIEAIHPNPFNPETTISFNLENASDISMKVYNLNGREMAVVASGRFEAGSHSMNVNGASWASGVYIVQLTSGQSTDMRKMTLIK